MTEPLTPADCDLRDFPRMMIDIPRLFGSDFDASANDAEWRFGVTAWLRSFHRVPAGSLPDDDVELARMLGFGRDVKGWRKIRPGALRGWVKCDDGKLYHRVVAETVLEAWIEKLGQRLSSGAGNAKRWEVEFDPSPVLIDISRAADLLRAINPKSKTLSRRHVVKLQSGLPPAVPPAVLSGFPPGRKTDPTGTPGSIPSGSQEKGREVSKSSDLTDRAPSAAAETQDEEAWRRAVAVLTSRGRMRDAAARSLFGKLLRDHHLEPRDLLPSVVKAEGTGTQDPQSYLTRAASAVASRRPHGKPKVAIDEWEDDRWATAIRLFWEDGGWDADMGPKPSQPGCMAPQHVLDANPNPKAFHPTPPRQGPSAVFRVEDDDLSEPVLEAKTG